MINDYIWEILWPLPKWMGQVFLNPWDPPHFVWIHSKSFFLVKLPGFLAYRCLIHAISCGTWYTWHSKGTASGASTGEPGPDDHWYKWEAWKRHQFHDPTNMLLEVDMNSSFIQLVANQLLLLSELLVPLWSFVFMHIPITVDQRS